MKKIKIFSLLIISAVILGGCSLGKKRATQSHPIAAPQNLNIQTDITAGGEQNKITEAKVMMENFAFSPETLIIKAGAIVVWINNDSAPHDVKSDFFTSPKLAKGKSFSFKFDNPGVFDYICGIHPKMKGKIIVE